MSKKTDTDTLKELRHIKNRNAGLYWFRLPALVPAPNLLIDVGVGSGTIGLYKAFPNTRIIGFEPLVDYEEKLAIVAKRYPLEVNYFAVGRESKEMEINVGGKGKLAISSLLTRCGALSKYVTETRKVQVRRLDEVIQPEGTIGLKIDAEGAEPDVVAGATGILGNVEWVVAEVSLAPRFKEDLLFAGLYEALSLHGFVFRDILEIVRQRSGDLRRVDAVFIKRHLLDYPVRDKKLGH